MAESNKSVDIEPPMACVSRVLKAALPENMAMTKEARLAFSRAVSVFIFYITHCANEICREHKRQTIAASDVMKALKELGYEDFEKPLEEFLELHKEAEENKKASKKLAGTKEMEQEDGDDQVMDTTIEEEEETED
eukprot:gene9666-10686_t